MSELVARLPATGVEVLESIAQHRLLSTGQVHQLHTPTSSRRWTQQLLNILADRGLLAAVHGPGAAKLWFLTELGADAVEAIPSRAELRRKVVTPEQAAGQLQQHTLAVNDVGLAFVQAARERGDECGPFAWRHEVAHAIGGTPGRRGGELVIADALLTYLQTDVDRVEQHQQFIELDRGTIPIDALLGKLHRYQRLRTHTPDQPRDGRPPDPAWRAHYQRLPAVAIVLAHKPRRALERAPAAAAGAPRLRPRPGRRPAPARQRRAARRPPAPRSVRRDLAGAARPQPPRRLARAPRARPAMSALPETAAEADAVGWELRCGDALQLLAGLEPQTIDAIVCDPPYGLDLNGAGWDGVAIRESAALHTGRQLDPAHAFTAWVHTWAAHALRALKPGGWLVAFGGTRTSHRLAAGLEDAGFQLRDSLCWLHGAGVPKSRRLPGGRATTLRPGWEPIVVARRPLATVTTIENVAAHSTGALNIDACRVEGRYPANVVVAHAEDCDEAQCAADCPLLAIDQTHTGPAGEGQRLFFVAKADRAERDAGCEQLPAGRPQLRFTRPLRRGHHRIVNTHPTIKPIALMRWLIRLTCPPGGLVLDPFCGSGSTGAAAVLEDRRFLGIDIDPDYLTIAHARISHWQQLGGDAVL